MTDPLFKNKKERYEKYTLEKDHIIFERDGSYWTNHGDPGYSFEAETMEDIIFEVFSIIQGLFKGPKVQEWLDTTEGRYFTYISMDKDGTVIVLQELSHELCKHYGGRGPCHPVNNNVSTRELVLPVKIKFKLDVEIDMKG